MLWSVLGTPSEIKNGIKWEKFPRGNFFDEIPFFLKMSQSEKNKKKIVNYVLASQDDFGMPKKTW